MSTTRAEDEPGGRTEDARLAEAKPPGGGEARGSERARGQGGARGAARKARVRALARRLAVAAAVRLARSALDCFYKKSAKGQKEREKMS